MERQRNEHEYSRRTAPDRIGSRLRDAREQRGDPLRRLAAVIGVSHQVLQKYENGLRTPSPGRIAAIAGALRVPVGQLISLNILQMGGAGRGGGG